ncbi:MAG: hypothetical protein QM778_38345 [Myxococcales bacterium]
MALLTWFVLGTAHAQVSTAERDDHPELLRRAVEAYQANDLVTARLLFEQLHAVAPTARTLRSLGLLAYREGRLSKARELLEQSLLSPVKPLTESLRADALKLLGDIRTAEIALAAQSEESSPPAAEIDEVEESQSSPSSEPEAADGTVLPAARATRRPPLPSMVSRQRGQTFALRSSGGAPSHRSSGSKRLKRAGYVLTVLGGGALVGSAIATSLGVTRLKGIEEVCRTHSDGQCSSVEATERERAARLHLLSNLALAGVIAGAGTAATGATMLLLHYRSGHGDTDKATVVSLTLRRSF